MVVGNDRFGFKIIVSPNRMEMKVCFDDKVYNSSNWAPDSNMVTAPTLYSQIATQIGLSGLIYLLLKPFNQSPLVAEVIAGIMIGPTLLGNFSGFVNNIFPFVSTTVLENFMNLGIIYYMSQLGMEMNLTPMLKIRRKTTIRAMAGMVLPMAIGFVSYFLVVPPMKPHEPILPKLKSAFVWGIVLTATNLPDLTRVLAEQKLMRTDIGRSAVASSFLSDIAMWVFLAVLISVSRPEYTIRLCISTIAFMLFCAFLARPALSWLISVTSKGKDYRERQVQFVLCGVLVAALITDSLGLGSLLGAFMFGFTLPSGQLTTTISERIEKVSSWIMVPLYCTVSGLKSNLPMMVPEGRSVMHVILFVGISWSAKVISTFLVSIGSQRMRRPQEIFTLGVLMNSKGLLAMIAINLGRELYVSVSDLQHSRYSKILRT
ncbi:hypothetical protein SAY86_023567 [Trapa natans]|uniref:Cation/H+ exchanger transmembrane domain-containing protein n=1 Tax=Trapa natans TaxID=22666 RepID=A0AAN7M8K5_TRANT|nr:hypothetical protein SAY86_022336 [Trapa natans]KAK4793132.1 hypothetical protein SAY86_023567 [Trapa natans]